MQMRWGRYGVKSARRIVRSSYPIGRWSDAIAFDASGKISNTSQRRSERPRR
jgi:hypothetical protein